MSENHPIFGDDSTQPPAAAEGAATRAESRGGRKGGRGKAIAGGVAAVALMAGGGYFAWDSAQVTPPPDAPTPTKEFSIAIGDAPTVKNPASFDKRDSGYQPHTIDLSSMGKSSVAIPSLGVEAPYSLAQKDTNNVWQVPRDIHKTSLLDTGVSLASQRGTAIIAGHVDHVGEGPGALHDLYMVKPGALVVTSDATGRKTKWKVTSLHSYVKEALPDSLFTSSGGKRLALVTCGGPVEEIDGVHQYRDNVVVIAQPASRAKISTSASA